jgi:hypothetical protein
MTASKGIWETSSFMRGAYDGLLARMAGASVSSQLALPCLMVQMFTKTCGGEDRLRWRCALTNFVVRSSIQFC